MNVTIICEETTRKTEYIEHIINNCTGIEHLPMKLILSFEECPEAKDLLTGTRKQTLSEKLLIKEPEREPLEDEVIESRGLKIDIPARRVWIDGEEHHFTPREFIILTYLAKRINKVVTKGELCKEIFGETASREHWATISVHMKNVRNKLEPNRKTSSYIETIRGVGYRFNG